jgi:hypothetical protein
LAASINGQCCFISEPKNTKIQIHFEVVLPSKQRQQQLMVVQAQSSATEEVPCFYGA